MDNKSFRAKSKETKELILSAYDFCVREKSNNEPILFKKPNYRTAAMFNINVSSVNRYIRERKELGAVSDPKYSLPRTTIIKELDDFTEQLVRRTILDYATIYKIRPTMKAIFNKVKESGEFPGQLSTFRKFVHRLGFSWRKTTFDRKHLVEKPEIRHLRIVYLREIRKFRLENRPIVYIDETYLHEGHTSPSEWTLAGTPLVKNPISKGRRLIIVHAGGEDGFVPNALLIFPSGLKTGDYHDDMNFANFTKWLEEMLFPNLQPNTVLVIDNAPYHNVQSDKLPTSNSKKAEL